MKIKWTEVLLLFLTGFFTIAMLTFLRPSCSPEMHCHAACESIRNLAAAMTLAALLQLFAPNRLLRLTACLVLAVMSTVTLLVPGTIMSLCMMPQMSCRSVMKPGVTVFSALILAFSLLNLFLNIGRREKK